MRGGYTFMFLQRLARPQSSFVSCCLIRVPFSASPALVTLISALPRVSYFQLVSPPLTSQLVSRSSTSVCAQIVKVCFKEEFLPLQTAGNDRSKNGHPSRDFPRGDSR